MKAIHTGAVTWVPKKTYFYIIKDIPDHNGTFLLEIFLGGN